MTVLMSDMIVSWIDYNRAQVGKQGGGERERGREGGGREGSRGQKAREGEQRAHITHIAHLPCLSTLAGLLQEVV